MRITNSMLISDYVRNLNKSDLKTSKLQWQISSGQKLLRASDDPLAANRIMGLRSSLSKVSQYKKNVQQAKQLLTQTETTLNEMNSILTRVYELNVKASNAANGDDEKRSIANEIGQLMEQVIESANTIFVERHIFGGYNTTKNPFSIKEEAGKRVVYYNDINMNELDNPENLDLLNELKSQKISFEVGFNFNMDISYNGIEVFGFGEDNLYSVLSNLKDALENSDQEAIEATIEKVSSHQSNILSLIGEVGGKTNRLNAFDERLENDKYNYEQMQKETEGIDIYQVILDLQNQEVLYQAALASGSGIIRKTLADFL